jgi:glycosyltransferase involved in cell wall biosynthesis
MISSACMVVQSYCPDDPRVAREAEALAAAGTRVDVICLRKRDEAPRETVEGVCYHRLPIRRRRQGKIRYLFEYGAFFLLAFALSSALALRRKYDVFHAHNFPDFLVFCGLFHRLRGAKLILDLHDLMPELFTAKFGLRESSLSVRLLKLQERLSCAFADLAITTTLAFQRALVSRSCDEEKIRIVLNSPDERIFPEPAAHAFRSNASFRLVFNGVIAHRSGPDVVIQALALLHDEIPGARLDVLGSGDRLEHCVSLSRELGLEDSVRFLGQKPFIQMPQYLADCDVGIVPSRLNPFTAANLPTRIFEYLRMKKIAIVARTPGIQDYFGEDGLLYFAAGDPEDLARAIREAYRDPDHAQKVMERGIRIYDRYRWEREKIKFLDLVEALVRGEKLPLQTQ